MRIARALLLVFGLAAALLPILPAAAQPAGANGDIQPNSAVAAPEWTALFDRTSGWTGADGVYTIPLNGDERNGAANVTSTFWVFSDTFVGGVDANGARTGAVMINNSMARLYGSQPDPARMTFYWGANGTGGPASRVLPHGGSANWFWPIDGIALPDKLHLFALRMRSDATAGFAVVGIDLLTSSLRSAEPFATYTQQTTPLYVPASGSYGDAYYGIAVTPNTAEAGAPKPDGYIYIYGVRNDSLNKKLLAARVRPESIANFDDYRYWDGHAWQPDITRARALYDRVSSEFSVTPLADGRYLLVFHLDAIGNKVAVSYGASPVGPWGPPIAIWTCPEDTMTRSTFTYGSKAHPHLSAPGELLISYHVNTDNSKEDWNNADIYRPRFIRVKLNQGTAATPAVPATAEGNPGDLNPTFGNGGTVVTRIGKGDERGAAGARQPDGKIVVAGSGSGGDVVVARYLPDGGLDATFGSNGIVTTDFAGQVDRATALALQADGKIVVGGTAEVGGQHDFAVARYLPNGALDPTLDGDGLRTIDFGGLGDEANALALQEDGKILLAGSSDVGSDQRDVAAVRLNPDGSLDSTFGSAGRLTTDVGGVGNSAYALTIQLDGKILVAGANFTGYLPSDDMLVVRYTTTGTLDSTFDADGIVTIDFAAAGDAARALAIQADGKIVVAGNAYAGASGDDFALARLNADGSLDASFSNDGKVTTDFAAENDLAQAVAVTPEGKILVAGRTQGATQDFALARYNIDGSLDGNFDADGRATTDFAVGADEASALLLLPDGRIIAAGTAAMETDNFALARYSIDGALDTTFGSSGKAATDFQLGDSGAYAVAIQADGKIVAAGESRTGRANGAALTVARYTPAGILDSSFGTGGTAFVDYGAPSQARAAALQADGKVLVAGMAGLGADGQFALARLNPKGTLDATFSANGKTTTGFAAGPSIANAVALQPDGKIVLAGIAGSGFTDFAFARYNPDGSLDTSFSGDGWTTVDINAGADAAWSVAVQGDGKIVAAGYAYSGATSDFALVRLNGDGTLDTSFDGDGKLMTDFSGANSSAYAVQVLSDGRIVAAGEVEQNGGDFALAKYTANGGLDTSFDADGLASTNLGSRDGANALLLQDDGQLLAAGSTRAADGRDDFALVRYNANGTLDTSFSSDGLATADFVATEATGLAAALQADGGIVLAGAAGNIALARFFGRPLLEVTIAADGKDVVLNWTMTSAATTCEVLRATTPYFAPGEPIATVVGTLNPCRAGPQLWRDPSRIGDPGVNYTYRVRTIGAAPGDSTSSGNGEFDYALVK